MVQVKTLTIIVVLTLLSGFADAQGFLHAAHIWEGRNPNWVEVGKSTIGFSTGIVLYWLALKYLAVQVTAPEIQTMLWFGVTIVGVAVVSGKFTHWRLTEQVIACGVVLGIGWLLLHTD